MEEMFIKNKEIMEYVFKQMSLKSSISSQESNDNERLIKQLQEEILKLSQRNKELTIQNKSLEEAHIADRKEMRLPFFETIWQNENKI